MLFLGRQHEIIPSHRYAKLVVDWGKVKLFKRQFAFFFVDEELMAVCLKLSTLQHEVESGLFLAKIELEEASWLLTSEL